MGLHRRNIASEMTLSCESPESVHGVADRSTYLSEFCRSARAEWPDNRTLNVVCHGHSVPAGYFLTPDVRTFDSYPHLLHVGLKRRFPFAVINVIVTAIGGEHSEAGAYRFERDVINLRPDVVTIDYALNDRRIGLETARASWVSMMERALRENIRVLLLTPTADVESRFDAADDPLNAHARQVRELAAEYGVGLVDSLAAFSEAVAKGTELSRLMSQGNHPNREGHELVTARLLEWFPGSEVGAVH